MAEQVEVTRSAVHGMSLLGARCHDHKCDPSPQKEYYAVAGFFDSTQMLIGGGAGTIKGGRHLKLRIDTPLANLHLAILEKMGLPMASFGDSAGAIEGLP